MSWDEQASSWDEHESVRAYASSAFDSLEKCCQELAFPLVGGRVCDFGCGAGLLSEKLARECSEVVAIDCSESMIAVLRSKITARKLHAIEPVALALTEEVVASNPLLREPFDVVVCSSVLAFLDNYPDTLALLTQLLRPGGLFVQWDWEFNPDDEEPFGLTRPAIRGAFQSAGLDLISLDVGFTIKNEEADMSPFMGVGIRRGLRA